MRQSRKKSLTRTMPTMMEKQRKMDGVSKTSSRALKKRERTLSCRKQLHHRLGCLRVCLEWCRRRLTRHRHIRPFPALSMPRLSPTLRTHRDRPPSLRHLALLLSRHRRALPHIRQRPSSLLRELRLPSPLCKRPSSTRRRTAAGDSTTTTRVENSTRWSTTGLKSTTSCLKTCTRLQHQTYRLEGTLQGEIRPRDGTFDRHVAAFCIAFLHC